jgi:hypothetical protein
LSSVWATVKVKVSPGTSLMPIIGVTPISDRNCAAVLPGISLPICAAVALAALIAS